jgi:uncharacterized protein (TIGR02246 family)
MAADEATLLETGLQDLLDRLCNAWDVADAAAFAQLFTEDATLAIWLGDALIGRSEIQEVHNELFATRASKMRLRAVNPRLVDDNTAIVLTKAAGCPKVSAEHRPLATSVRARSRRFWRRFVIPVRSTNSARAPHRRRRQMPTGPQPAALWPLPESHRPIKRRPSPE